MELVNDAVEHEIRRLENDFLPDTDHLLKKVNPRVGRPGRLATLPDERIFQVLVEALLQPYSDDVAPQWWQRLCRMLQLEYRLGRREHSWVAVTTRASAGYR